MGVLHPQLNRVGLMESCTPLFNTLRLAGTTATEPGGNPKLLQPGPSFQSETGLTNYVKHKVMYRNLPELERPWDPPGDPALTAAVTALTDHQLKLSENMDHKRSQSVRTTWGPLYTQRLLLLCTWAQKSKHERTHMIFQSQVAARASELGIQAPPSLLRPSNTSKTATSMVWIPLMWQMEYSPWPTSMTTWPSLPPSKINSGNGTKRHMPDQAASAIHHMASRPPHSTTALGRS
eukprot:jgi/Psemu1/56537/gm1.56537_g